MREGGKLGTAAPVDDGVLLSAVFEAMVDAMIVIDGDGIIERVNPATCTMFGYDEFELIGHDVCVLMPEPTRSAHRGFIRHFVDTDEQRVIGVGREVEGMRKDGSVFPLHLAVAEALVGGSRRFTGILRDMTDVRERQRELVESARKLELAEQVAGVGHWYLRLGAPGPEWSKEVFRIHGRDPALGEPEFDEAIEYYHEHDRELVSEAVTRTLQTRQDSEFKLRLIRDDGELRYVHARARANVEGGEVVGLFGTFQDVTESRAREEQLVQLSTVQKAILDSANESIISTDLYGNIWLFSTGAEAMLGYTAEEIVGHHSPALIHEPEEVVRRAEELSREVGQTIEPGFDVFVWKARHGGMDEREWTYIRKDGSRLTVSLSVTALRDDTGDLMGFLGIARDVTELRTTVEKLEKSRQKLAQQTAMLTKTATEYARERQRAEAANRAKSEFLAVMSHELRTPMTGVLGMVDLLEQTSLRPEQREYVQTLGNSARGLLELLNDILDLSKLESGRVEIERTDYRLDDVVAQVGDLLGPKASSKGILFASTVPSIVPRALFGDPTRLRQVLLNLVGNSIKFTSEGSIELAVTMDASRGAAQPYLRFEVFDTGIGMTHEQVALVFDPFVQADSSTSRKFGGTGLGLAICKRIVEAMGGRIGVKSQPGKGSCFWFTVPLEHARLNPAPSKRVVPAVTADVGALQILVAEDTATNRLLLRQMLSRKGHTVVCVENGAEALERVQDEPFDIVLMDMQMPVMDGPTATKKIRELGGDFATLPILALTADAMPEHRPRYAAAGLTDFLTKPIDWPTLFHALATHARPRPANDTSSARAPEDTPAAPATVLDDSKIHAMQQALGEGGCRDMLAMLPEELARLMESLGPAVQAGDAAGIERAAHQIKGVGLNFGATAVCETSLAMERAPSDDGVRQLFEQLCEAVADVSEDVSRRLSA